MPSPLLSPLPPHFLICCVLWSITAHLTRNTCSVTAQKIACGPPWWGAGGCLSTLPGICLPLPWLLSAVWICSQRLLCPRPSAAIEARLRGPSEDDWSCAGQRMVLETSAVLLYVCACARMTFSEMWSCCLPGWGRVVSFHQRQRFPTLLLAYFSDRISSRQLMVPLQSVNRLAVERGFGYLCVQFITT